MKKYSYYLIALIFAALINGCGKNNAELWTEAVELQKNNKTEEALKVYQELVDEFPDSYEAPKAMFEIAKINHSKGMKSSDHAALNKAMENYKKVYENYPSSEEAPKALFMVGFIQSNDLGNFDAARETYKIFIEKYPKHEMSQSAQKEIDNMGLSPEEILRRNLEAKK